MTISRASVNLTSSTVRRVRLASKFLNVWASELVDSALDNYGIPRFIKPAAIRPHSVKRLDAHLDLIRQDGSNAALESYFEREIANDN